MARWRAAWVMRLLVAGMVETFALGVVPTAAAAGRGPGEPTVLVGATCVIKEGWIIALTKADLALAERLILDDDTDALQKMIMANRAALAKGGTTAVVERRDGLHVEVRPKGEFRTLWINTLGLECSPPTPKPTPKPPKRP
jgi:hypothetical protein